ncbi:MAG: DUF4097 family beta strand repeat protein [Clostridia bacterium]|nr:DUF4097 family beta strand repeat protein [Clostridia bacterium]
MKKLLIIALIILGAGLVLSFVAFAVAGFNVDNLNAKNITEKDYIFEEQTLDSIVIDAVTADVRVIASDTATKAYLTVRADSRKAQTVKCEGGVLTVDLDTLPWYKTIGIGWGNEQITLTIPKARQGDISIKLTTGDVDVVGVSAESLTAEVTTGDIGLDRVDISGRLTLTSTTGDMTVEHARALGAVTVMATTGDVELSFTDTPKSIDVELTTGDVEMDLVNTMNFNVETTTGRKRVPHSDPSAPVCRVKTTTGDISIQYGIED